MPDTIGSDDGKNGGSQPAVDQNIVTPAAMATGTANPGNLPEEEKPKTPEFLKHLIEHKDELQAEQSELFAKMYPMNMSSGNNAPTKPPYETMEMYHRMDREFDSKIAALRVQIDQLHVLLAREPEAKPELDTEKAEAAPAAPAPELKGPM